MKNGGFGGLEGIPKGDPKDFQKKWVTAKQQQSLTELIDYLKNKTHRGRPTIRVPREQAPPECPGQNFPVKKLHALFG